MITPKSILKLQISEGEKKSKLELVSMSVTRPAQDKLMVFLYLNFHVDYVIY